jgi:PAS domain S-box-containing protein
MTDPLDYSGLAREELIQRLQALERAEAEGERLRHELEVHQVELEQQNQALRETQLALEASRDRYVQLFEFAPVGYLVLDPKGWIRQANRVASQMLGREPGQLVGKRLSSFLVPGSADSYWLALRRQIQGGDFICPELELLGEGPTRAVHLECQPPLKSEGVGGSLHLALVDMTERRRKEAELQRLNRTLQAISRSHRALLHAEEEAELLAEVCRIVVEDCGHALAWIGFAQDDPGRTVRVAAHAGDDQGYLGTLDLSWADTERGHGPAGSALRDGRVAFCRDLDSDPRFAPWREEARKWGFTAALAIPLLEVGQAFGVLTIFSREQDRFSPAEVELLGDLAEDLAFGIRTLRLRADHARSEAELRDRENLLRTVAENTDRKSTRLNSSHRLTSRMPSSA